MIGIDPAAKVIDIATGERIEVIRSGAETQGRFTEGVSIYPPSLAAAAYHEHPEQEERVTVVSGTVLVRIDGRLQLAGPGDAFVIPAGTAHEIANAGAEPAEVLWQFRPALRTDAYLAAAIGGAGRAEGGLRRRLRRMAIAAEFTREYRSALLPWTLQRPVLALFRRLTRARRLSLPQPFATPTDLVAGDGLPCG